MRKCPDDPHRCTAFPDETATLSVAETPMAQSHFSIFNNRDASLHLITQGSSVKGQLLRRSRNERLTNFCLECCIVLTPHHHRGLVCFQMVHVDDFGLSHADATLPLYWVYGETVARGFSCRCAVGVVMGHGSDINETLVVGLREDDYRMISNVALPSKCQYILSIIRT